MTRHEIVQSMAKAVAEAAPQVGTVSEDTHLMGPRAVLDSVGFVTFLVALEQHLDSTVDLSSAFLGIEASDESHNPFLTIGSLAAHIEQLLGQA